MDLPSGYCTLSSQSTNLHKALQNTFEGFCSFNGSLDPIAFLDILLRLSYIFDAFIFLVSYIETLWLSDWWNIQKGQGQVYSTNPWAAQWTIGALYGFNHLGSFR